MSDTLPNIEIEAGEWRDIYALTGIPVGTRIEVENVGTCDVHLAVQAVQPAPDHDEFNILKRSGPKMTNNAGDVGAWALCNNTDGKLNVSVQNVNGFSQTLMVDPSVSETPENKSYKTDAWFRNKAVIDDSILHGMFTYNVPADKWFEMIDDVEQTSFVSATSENGKLVLSSGALNEKRQLRSFRNPRYEPNRGHLWSDSMFFPDSTADAERSAGMFTKEAGAMFRLRSGNLYAVRRTTIDSVTTDFEQLIDLPPGIDLEKGNIFDIQFQWRGVGSYFFYIDLQLVAVLDLLGTLDELSLFNPALPIAFETINQGDAADLVVGCVDITTEGGKDNGKSYGSIGISTETGSVAISGFNIPIIVVRNKTLFGALLNTRDMIALLATAYSDQRCVFRVWATRDETAITLNDQSWTDFRDGHIEYIEYDNPPVANEIEFDTTKAQLVFSSRVDQDQNYSTSALFEGRTEIHQTPGDIFIFTMHRETGGNTSVGVTYEFAEAI